MKRYTKLFAALALLLALALSLPVVAEDAVIEESVSNTADDIVVTPEEDEAVELSPEIDLFDGELLMPEDAPEISAPEAEEAPAAKAAVEAQPTAANAIPTKLTLGVKETYKIDTSGLKGKITYKSSKTKVATVSKKGVIKAKKAGKTKITISPKKGKKKTITVTVKKAPAKVTLNKVTATLETGKTLQLKATLPSKTASNKLTWTSSKKSVATVDDNGKVTAVKAGTATITVKTFNGKTATCKVTVKKTAGYSGDIWAAIGKNIDWFNNYIDDPLTLYSYEEDYISYINEYMIVNVSYVDDSILAIGLYDSDKSGKYTIDGIRPGYNLITAKMHAEAADWTYWYTEGSDYYYSATYEGKTIYLAISSSGNKGSSIINYVTILLIE